MGVSEDTGWVVSDLGGSVSGCGEDLVLSVAQSGSPGSTLPDALVQRTVSPEHAAAITSVASRIASKRVVRVMLPSARLSLCLLWSDKEQARAALMDLGLCSRPMY